MPTIARMLIALGVDGRDLTEGLLEGAAELQRFSGEVDRTNRQAASLAATATSLRSGLAGFAQAALATLGTAGIGAALGEATRAATDFGAAMAEVSTLLDRTDQLPELARQVAGLSSEFGKAPVEEAKALYQIISAGATNARDAVSLLDASNRLAVGGVTTVANAADGLTNVLNAYHLAADQASRVSDALFVAMKAGKTTIGELASSLSTVAPLAAAAGVSVEELLAAVSALAKAGVPTAVAMSGLRAALAAVSKPSTEAIALAQKLGLEFSATALHSKGLAAFLDDVKQKTGGSTAALGTLFGGVEALVPVLTLAGEGGGAFTQILGLMQQKAGATEQALSRMAATPAEQFARLRSQLSVAAIDLGNVLLKVAVPATEALSRNLGTIVDVLLSVAQAVGVVTAAWLVWRNVATATAIAQTVTAFLSLIPAITGVADALTLAGFAFDGFLAALGPIGLAIAAIGLLTAAIFGARRATQQAKEESDRWVTSLGTLNKTQLKSLETDLLRQVTAAQKTVDDLQAASQQFDADRGQLTGGVAANPELDRATVRLEHLQGLLGDVREAMTHAVDTPPNAGAAANAALAAIQQRADALAASLQAGGTKGKTAFDKLQETVTAVAGGITAMRDRVNAAIEPASRLTDQLDRARTLLASLERQISTQEAAGQVPNTALLQLAGQLRQTIADATAGAFDPLIRQASDAADRATAIFARTTDRGLQSAALTTLEQQYQAVEAAIAAQGGPLRANLSLLQLSARLLETILQNSPLPDGLEEKIDAVAQHGLQLAAAWDKAHGSADDFVSTLDQLGGIARGALEIGDALGDVGQGARKAIDGIELLIDSLKKLKTAKDATTGQLNGLQVASGVIGLIGAGANLLSGLFGGGPSASDQLLKENNDQLSQLRHALEGATKTFDQTQRAGEAARLLSTSGAAAGAQALQQFSGTDFAIQQLDRELAQFGLSFDQLQQIAKDNGISLLDQNGRIVAAAFDQLADATGITIEAMTRFASSFDEQTRRNALHDKLFGTGTGQADIDKLQQDIDALKVVAPDLAKLFDGIDLSTAEGRAAALRLFQRLFDQFDTGFFTAHPELLGGLTKDDFVRFLEDGADALSDLAAATNAATTSMLNVPTGFKIAADRFKAEIPNFTPATIPGPSIDPGRLGQLPEVGPSSAVSGADAVTGSGDVYVIQIPAGAFQVTTEPGESPEDFADRVFLRLRQKARAQSGDTLGFNRLN